MCLLHNNTGIDSAAGMTACCMYGCTRNTGQAREDDDAFSVQAEDDGDHGVWPAWRLSGGGTHQPRTTGAPNGGGCDGKVRGDHAPCTNQCVR